MADDQAELQRPQKRAKTESPARYQEHPSGSTDETLKEDIAFYLTKLPDAPEAHNRYAVSLQELLEGDFTQCLLTNYMFDLPWLFGKCKRLSEVPVLLVHGERDRAAMTQECKAYSNVSVVAPPLPIPYGTHHTKMMVMVYPTKVRVVICTANFIAVDWDHKTQGVWFQDFELKTLDDSEPEEKQNDSSSGSGNSTQLPDFEADLVHYLSCLGAKVAVFCKELARFDFSTAQVALIPSVPGVHKGKDMEKYGHVRVRRLLKMLKAPVTNNPLICQYSSCGSLDEKWLFGEFARSLMPGSTLITASSAAVQALHIIWPSVEDVRNSNQGWNAGRAIPCPLKNMKPFLHKYLRKWTPPECLHRQNAMPHIKSYARFDPSAGERSGALDYAILTSANLSKAAWGSFQKNETQLMIRSYELGVLFVPQHIANEFRQLAVIGSKAAAQALLPKPIDGQATTIQRSLLLPLPYRFPIKTYNPKEDEPWVWDLVREEPDIFGSCYIPH